MALATIVFWLGRNLYVKVPPREEPHSFLAVLRSAWRNRAAAFASSTVARPSTPQRRSKA